MKFIHLGDLHIGKSLGDFSLIADQEYILNQIVDIALDRGVDAVLVAGDIYDKAVPSEEAVRLLDRFLRRLVDEKIKVFAITGNHDSDERLNFGSALFENNGVYLCAKYEGELYHRSLSDEFGTINVYLLPFVKASTVKHFHEDAIVENYEDAINLVINNAKIDTSERNIIVSHQFVTSQGKSPELSGSEGPSVTGVGLVEEISSECYRDFDYAALGHIHSPQRIGREEVRYSGSLLKYSLSEADKAKTIPLITLGEKGRTDIELIPLKPMRDLRHIKGTVKQLLDRQNISTPEDFVYVTLTDEDIVNDAMALFQQYYPNTVRIDYENSRTKAVENIDFSAGDRGKSFDELISEFYSEVYGTDISDEELKILHEVAREAGVVYEAD